MSAAEAARRLGITPATLYAYVSRGLIRSERAEGRTRRYHAADIAALERGERPDGPVLTTRITLIRDDRVFFRGHDAEVLARTLSVREAAALMWRCDPVPSFAAQNIPDWRPAMATVLAGLVEMPPSVRMLALLQVAIAAEPRSLDVTPEFFGYAGARLIRFLAGAAAAIAPSARPIEAVLAETWGLSRETRPLLRAGIILAADEGIDATAMAARAAAAAGMPLWRSVAAGLTALEFETNGIGDLRAATLLSFLPRSRVAAKPRTLPAALVALGDALGIPAGGAEALYRIGRSIGLVAHVAEERVAKSPFRARGGYVGRRPNSGLIPQSSKG